MFLEPQQPGDRFAVSDADTMLHFLAPNAKRPEQVAILTRERCSFFAWAQNEQRSRVRIASCSGSFAFGARKWSIVSASDTANGSPGCCGSRNIVSILRSRTSIE